jgi:putative spermidine/putrescine transport system ATP-binding protein
MSGQPGAAASGFVVFADVQKSYDGETLVVRDLNLSIRQGEFLTLLGPSGSGKTTTLMMLAGFETPTSGSIYLDGKQIDAVAPFKRNIGMVFQNYALFPHMTVAENLAFPLQVRSLSREERARRIDKALEMVKLAQFRNRRPGQLSGGQQQRVALARALVFDPALVLMDEPLGALDKQLREHMQLEIKHLHQQLGITIVYVTHDQSEALTMSDRVAVFNDGAIRQLATPAELYERPENSFVAQFIGENNRLRGVIDGYDGEDCLVRVAGDTPIRARAVAASRIGTETTLSLRPERVRIGDGAGGNAFDARIEELIYLGDHTRLRVSLLGRSDFMVKVPIAEGAATLIPGATIRVAWRPEDCRALDPI